MTSSSTLHDFLEVKSDVTKDNASERLSKVSISGCRQQGKISLPPSTIRFYNELRDEISLKIPGRHDR